jgi:hypothetical protein
VALNDQDVQALVWLVQAFRTPAIGEGDRVQAALTLDPKQADALKGPRSPIEGGGPQGRAQWQRRSRRRHLTPKGYLSGGDELDELERAIKRWPRGQCSSSTSPRRSTSTRPRWGPDFRAFELRAPGRPDGCGRGQAIENIFVITKLSLVFVFPDRAAGDRQLHESKPV